MAECAGMLPRLVPMWLGEARSEEPNFEEGVRFFCWFTCALFERERTATEHAGLVRISLRAEDGLACPGSGAKRVGERPARVVVCLRHSCPPRPGVFCSSIC